MKIKNSVNVQIPIVVSGIYGEEDIVSVALEASLGNLIIKSSDTIAIKEIGKGKHASHVEAITKALAYFKEHILAALPPVDITLHNSKVDNSLFDYDSLVFGAVLVGLSNICRQGLSSLDLFESLRTHYSFDSSSWSILSAAFMGGMRINHAERLLSRHLYLPTGLVWVLDIENDRSVEVPFIGAATWMSWIAAAHAGNVEGMMALLMDDEKIVPMKQAKNGVLLYCFANSLDAERFEEKKTSMVHTTRINAEGYLRL